MDDLFDDALDVTMTLSEVQVAKLGRTLACGVVRLEYGALGTLTLSCKSVTQAHIIKN